MREGFPSGSESKESSWNVGDLGSIPVMTEAHIELTWFAKNNFWLLKRHPCTHITLWIGRYRQTVCAKSLQLCPPLCHSMNCSPSDSSVHGILHIRILEYVATPSSRGSSWPVMEPEPLMSPALTGRLFPTSTTWEAHRQNNSSQR